MSGIAQPEVVAMPHNAKRLLAIGLSAAAVALPVAPIADADPGRVIGGGTQAPLDRTKFVIDILRKVSTSPKSVPRVSPKPRPREFRLPLTAAQIRESSVVAALRNLDYRKGAARVVKWTTCRVLEANYDYSADEDVWIELIVANLPDELIEETAENSVVFDIVAYAIGEVASPLSTLTSNWTGPFYLAACS
jgi:hypothetical protein